MVFDPHTSKESGQQGYTSCHVDDLPSSAPGRSEADNLMPSWSGDSEIQATNSNVPSGKLRSSRFSRIEEKGSGLVEAHKSVQFGTKAQGEDATLTGVMTVGDCKDDGQ